MSVTGTINGVAAEIKKELNHDVDLTIGNLENTTIAVPILCERMDKICAMMDWQSTCISEAEAILEEAKFQYKRKELIARKKYNEAFIGYKQEDRVKPKDQRRTDKEYEAMAELESDIELNEALSSEKIYMHAMHALDDTKHTYETLENHFLAYRKACDLLSKEMSKGLNDSRFLQRNY